MTLIQQVFIRLFGFQGIVEKIPQLEIAHKI